MNRYVHQIPFAAEGAFVWNRATVHDGKPVKQGDPVNNAAFTSVRLRQMYDARMIVPAPAFGHAPPPAYLENGRGKADKLAREIAAEESTQGKGADAKPAAQSRPVQKPAPTHGASSAKPAHAVGKAGAKRVGNPKPAKSAPKRAAR